MNSRPSKARDHAWIRWASKEHPLCLVAQITVATLLIPVAKMDKLLSSCLELGSFVNQGRIAIVISIFWDNWNIIKWEKKSQIFNLSLFVYIDLGRCPLCPPPYDIVFGINWNNSDHFNPEHPMCFSDTQNITLFPDRENGTDLYANQKVDGYHPWLFVLGVGPPFLPFQAFPPGLAILPLQIPPSFYSSCNWLLSANILHQELVLTQNVLHAQRWNGSAGSKARQHRNVQDRCLWLEERPGDNSGSSFKKCCITNTLDGIYDNFVWKTVDFNGAE